MPSGKTHDALTTILAVPTFVVAMQTGGVKIAAVVTFAFLFGGLMFGPDLDTHSEQHKRWGIFRLIWLPYKIFFPHRSRWTHGLIAGALFRVVYFMGAVSLIAFLLLCAVSTYQGGGVPSLVQIMESWGLVGAYLRLNFGENIFWFVFVGVWTGAASHTLTDMSVSYLKTGRIMEFL